MCQQQQINHSLSFKYMGLAGQPGDQKWKPPMSLEKLSFLELQPDLWQPDHRPKSISFVSLLTSWLQKSPTTLASPTHLFPPQFFVLQAIFLQAGSEAGHGRSFQSQHWSKMFLFSPGSEEPREEQLQAKQGRPSPSNNSLPFLRSSPVPSLESFPILQNSGQDTKVYI